MRGNIFFLFFLVLNIITFLVFGLDKQRAKKNKKRYRTTTLFGLCFLGGAFGGYLAMFFFHHKTKQKKFLYGIPLIMMLQIAIFFYLTKL